MIKVHFVVLPILICLSASAEVLGQEKDLNNSVFNTYHGFKWHAYRNNEQALYKIISTEAYRLLEERQERVSKLQTQAHWDDYRTEVRSKLFSSMEKFERTPLNAKITGTIKRPGFTVEKIIFESQPGFYVTACLFLPKQRQMPGPTIIYCSGHTDNGFRSETYQLAILNLVDKGFIVLAFDPIGQGERGQYIDPKTGKSKIGLGTKEHSYAGIQTLLSGTSLTDYFVWDGSRAVDYLLTRKEVDPKRIGITGRSGGGTQSGMIAAYDERIYAAAPEAWMNNFKRLLQSIGPQDAEQNPYQIIKKGIDYPDYLHLRAPKPTLIVTTDHDFFSIHGARETYLEAQRSYHAFGKPKNLQMTEDDGVHQSTRNNREALYAFFQTQLGLPGDPTEKEMTTFKAEELQVTETGQISTAAKSKTIFDLNQIYFKDQTVPEGQMKKAIKNTAALSFDRQITAAVYTGKRSSAAYRIEKYFLEQNKEDYALPVITISSPKKTGNKILVWLHDAGKDQIAEDELLLKLLAAGFTIISADLPGVGELRDPNYRGDGFIEGVPNNYIFGAQMVGKSIPGIQAEAIDLLLQFVQKQNTASNPIYALAEGAVGSALLHFTSQKNPFTKMAICGTTRSNRLLMETEYYSAKQAFTIVPGSLGIYDVQDLVEILPKGAIEFFDEQNPEQSAKPSRMNSTNKQGILDFLLKR